MSQESIEIINTETLHEKVRAMRARNFRLVQISAARVPDQIELTYSFDLDRELKNLRLYLPGCGGRLPSISEIYICAVLYENEIHDLFEVSVDGLALDFKGNFYKTRVKFPFGSTKVPRSEGGKDLAPADLPSAPKVAAEAKV